MRESPEYEDFVVRVDRHGDGYQMQLTRSPYGPKTEKFTPPFKQGEVVALLDRLDTIVPSSFFEPQDSPLPEDIGNRLFKSLFSGTIGDRLSRSLAHVETKKNAGLRIRIEIRPSEPCLAYLANLPWELMYDPEANHYLGQCIRTPIVRYLDVDTLHNAAPVSISELRILVCISSPKNMGYIDDEDELERIQKAWGHLSRIRIVGLPRPATLDTLRKTLRDFSPHVFHFIGHGTFETSTGFGSLLFENINSSPVAVTGQLLAATLSTATKLRLAFLNSCEGARIPRQAGQDPYRGVATALLQGGVTSVIANQLSITNGAAMDFSDAFYQALAAGDPVEVSVVEGRLAVQRQTPQSLEWMTPVLYMSALDGRILDRTEIKESKSRADQSQAATSAYPFLSLKQYDAAAEILNQRLRSGSTKAEDFYLIAIARLAGKRPRTLSLGMIQYVEKNLRNATELDPTQAHFYYLWALIRLDFYPWNGLRMPSPSVETLLRQAEKALKISTELERILEHIPVSNSPVLDAIQRLRES